jgi:hypothetical protein
LRNKETCPCLKNFSKLESSKLQELCIKAFQKQIEVLKQHEGEDLKLISDLRNELRDVNYYYYF